MPREVVVVWWHPTTATMGLHCKRWKETERGEGASVTGFRERSLMLFPSGIRAQG